MKNILVSGGAGFLGSHLCLKLIENGDKVICLDSLYTGDMKNISSLLKNKNFIFLNHDIRKKIDIPHQIDQIYNMASPASPKHYQKNPIFTLETNFIGVKNLLDLATKKGATILQSSTSEVYGMPEKHPQYEEYNGNVNTIGIRSCYDEGKRISETLLFDYHRFFKTKIKLARIFNTYGPKMSVNDGRVVSNFIYQAIKNNDITIYGDGKQTRSFCYVSDLISGLIKLMNSDESIKGPINLGNPQEITIKELAKTIIKLTKSKSNLSFYPIPQDDPSKRKPDITKAYSTLDWNPIIDLQEGLKKTIDYFLDIKI